LMKIINLLPKDEQRQLQLDIVNHQLRVFWIIILISITVFVGLGFATQQYLKLSLKSVDEKIALNKAKLETADIKALQQQVIKLNQNTKEIKSIRSQQYQWSEVLLELARVIPGEVELNSIQIKRSTGEIVILGKAQDRDTVIQVWSDIKKSPMFRDVNFPLPNLEQPVNGNFTYAFFINMENIKQDELQN
jgi:Tfp pilus assembly protein PilN